MSKIILPSAQFLQWARMTFSSGIPKWCPNSYRDFALVTLAKPSYIKNLSWLQDSPQAQHRYHHPLPMANSITLFSCYSSLIRLLPLLSLITFLNFPHHCSSAPSHEPPEGHFGRRKDNTPSPITYYPCSSSRFNLPQLESPWQCGILDVPMFYNTSASGGRNPGELPARNTVTRWEDDKEVLQAMNDGNRAEIAFVKWPASGDKERKIGSLLYNPGG